MAGVGLSYIIKTLSRLHLLRAMGLGKSFSACHLGHRIVRMLTTQRCWGLCREPGGGALPCFPFLPQATGSDGTGSDCSPACHTQPPCTQLKDGEEDIK